MQPDLGKRVGDDAEQQAKPDTGTREQQRGAGAAPEQAKGQGRRDGDRMGSDQIVAQELGERG